MLSSLVKFWKKNLKNVQSDLCILMRHIIKNILEIIWTEALFQKWYFFILKIILCLNTSMLKLMRSYLQSLKWILKSLLVKLLLIRSMEYLKVFLIWLYIWKIFFGYLCLGYHKDYTGIFCRIFIMLTLISNKVVLKTDFSLLFLYFFSV